MFYLKCECLKTNLKGLVFSGFLVILSVTSHHSSPTNVTCVVSEPAGYMDQISTKNVQLPSCCLYSLWFYGGAIFMLATFLASWKCVQKFKRNTKERRICVYCTYILVCNAVGGSEEHVLFNLIFTENRLLSYNISRTQFSLPLLF